MIPEELKAKALRWLDGDPSEETTGELRSLLERNDEKAEAELRERFAGPLECGTAGLRGVIGAGESRRNRAVATSSPASGSVSTALSNAGSGRSRATNRTPGVAWRSSTRQA